MRCILGTEDLGSYSAADLPVAVDESDAEGTAGCSRSGLDAPGPHHWIPGRCSGCCNGSCCVHAACIWEGVQYAITGQDDDHEKKWE